MIYKIFSVYDAKSEAYLPPFFLSTKGQAIRAFTDCIQDPNHQFSRHPEDYMLFEFGAFDDSSGRYDILEAPVAMGSALEFRKEN